MPFTISDLIEDSPPPVYVKPADSIRDALDLMIKHDFSQLPVVDTEGKPLGMVTSDSILRALKHFGATISTIRVADAMTRHVSRRDDSDLFEMLNVLRETGAVLIVDGEGKLIGIATHYDTTEYFRRRAEDIMLVEDIESAIKGHLEAAHTDPSTGEIDEIAQASAVTDVTDNTKASKGRFRAALSKYLELQGINAEIMQDSADEAFSILESKGPPKAFADLTLHDYIQLLLHPTCSKYCDIVFDIDKGALRNLLEGVRATRNILAHFRGEILDSQRQELRFCADWLERHPAAVPVAWPVYKTEQSKHRVLREDSLTYVTASEPNEEIAPTEEELGPRDSRYAPLALWLQACPAKTGRVQLSFEKVEELIQGDLPSSARTHRAWWANDSVGHVQSQQWLEVGWRVAQINMTEERVTFARIRERESAYIAFFSALLTEMRAENQFPLRNLGPDGSSWHTATSLPKRGSKSMHFIFAFTRGQRFRVELYIDTGDQDKNKQIFDGLYTDRDKVHEALAETVEWERLSEKRASRIAWYRPGAITDNEEALAALRTWAVDAVVRFYDALAEPVEQAFAAAKQSGL